jgi:hypothetical protein
MSNESADDPRSPGRIPYWERSRAGGDEFVEHGAMARFGGGLGNGGPHSLVDTSLLARASRILEPATPSQKRPFVSTEPRD